MSRNFISLFGSGGDVLPVAAGGAAPTFDSAGSADGGGNPGPSVLTTASVTVVGAENADFLIVCVEWDNVTTARTVTGITYAGAALTQVASALSTGAGGSEQFGCDIWYKAAPASGANTLETTMSGTCNSLIHGWQSWKGVHQTVPVGTATIGTGTASPGTIDVSSATTEVVVGVCGGGFTVAAISSGDTERWEDSNNVQVDNAANGSSQTGAATVTMDWTITSFINARWVASGVSLKPA